MRIAALLFLPVCLFSSAASAQVSSHIKLLCNWHDTANAPINGGGQYWNDVWGFTNKGKEYAVIGGTNGAHIIDIDACTERAFLPGRSKGVVHRDYATYSHYLYAVADEGISTLQVFDYSYLPDSVHFVWESNPATLALTHDVFIDTAKAKLYCASAFSLGSGHDDIQVHSLANPELPVLIAKINEYDNTHDIYVRNDTAWCSNGFAGYLMLDMSRLPQYKIIGGLISYPYKGYNHSSWVGYDYIGVMADESFGKPMKVIDARNTNTIEVLSTFGPRGDDSTSIPHNPYILGHYAIISYYMDGLQIYDLSDPRHPVQAGYYDTYRGPDVQNYLGAWGAFPFLPSRRILVSDMQTGLYVLDADEAMKISRKADFSFYPNPVEDKFFLQIPFGLNGPLTGAVYSITGAVVARINREVGGYNPPLEVSLPTDLRPGLYFFRAMIGGQSFTARFTKR